MRTHRLSALHVAAAVAAILVLVAPAFAAPRWQLYQNKDLGFAIGYPKDWTVASQQGGVALQGPQVAGVSGLRLGVTVAVETVASGVKEEDFTEATRSKQRSQYKNYREHRADEVRAGIAPATIRYITWQRADGADLYQMQLTTVAGKRGYVVTGTTSTSSNNQREELTVLLSILQSFRPR